MKNFNIIKNLKVIVLALVIGLGVSFAYGSWVPPTGTAPSNNAPAPLNIGGGNQSKGGTQAPLASSLLNINGILSANDILSFGDVGSGSLSHDANPGLDPSDYPAHVCADINGVLVLCGATVLTAHSQVYSLNSSGVQVTSGDCTACTSTAFVVPTNATNIKVKVEAAGGGGGGTKTYYDGLSLNNYPQYSGCGGTGSNPNVNCTVRARGAGGGGGATSIFSLTGAFPSALYQIVIGSGGAAGTNVTTSGNGGTGSAGNVSTVNLPGTGFIYSVPTSVGQGGAGGSSLASGTIGQNGYPTLAGQGGAAGLGNISAGQNGDGGYISWTPAEIGPVPPTVGGTGKGGISGSGNAGGTNSGACNTNPGSGGAWGCPGGPARITFTWSE